MAGAEVESEADMIAAPLRSVTAQLAVCGTWASAKAL